MTPDWFVVVTADWFVVAVVAVVVFAAGTYVFLAWRTRTAFDVTMAVLCLVGTLVVTRGLLHEGVLPLWMARVVVLGLILLPAVQALHQWVRARRFVAQVETALDNE